MLKRFVLLCSPRSGSNLVALALKAHPAVVMRGELFHPVEAERKAWQEASAEFPFPLDDYYRDGADPVAFLDKHVYGRPSPAGMTTAGFKLFYTHLRDRATVGFWDWLVANRDIHIIHLHRKHLLEAFVSYAIANRTHEWAQLATAPVSTSAPPPLTIDLEQLKRYIDETTAYCAQMEATFASHPLLTIEYHADVCARFEDTMARIEKLLGIASMPLPQRLRKQAKLPLSEEVSNFDAIHEALEGTRYEAYL
ncbi:hypothetical protein AYO44_11930 [Planctomycetaceae bacterium SCGC AG-212-F19]|nr:hypothetical protein AYO44_11930 [Planctomycetaceae bacterium SCGC AG-212-F19]